MMTGPRSEPNWLGAFTREHYPGAMPNGTRVIKVAVEESDAHPIGARATVLGSMGSPEVGFGYFVEWDSSPRVAVFVASSKIKAEQ